MKQLPTTRRIDEIFSTNYVDDRPMYSVHYRAQTSGQFYDGWYSDSMESLRALSGSQAQEIDDETIKDFARNMRLISGVGELAVFQNRIHLSLKDELAQNWPADAESLRMPVAALAAARLVGFHEVEFVEMSY